MIVLLVEDDIDLGNLLSRYLELQGMETLLARDGIQGLKMFESNEVDLCVLDIMIPGMDGFELARKIRKRDNIIPFIFLTAKSQKEDKIKGLKLGADDYIIKPFEADELVLRIRNILKRAGKIEPELYPIGRFEFSFNDLQLKSTDQNFHLTLKEAELLRYFLQNRNKVLKREEILKELWGENDYFLGRSMDVFVSRIRKYLKTEKKANLDTVRGVGFAFRLNN